jgi:hypothetical protein
MGLEVARAGPVIPNSRSKNGLPSNSPYKERESGQGEVEPVSEAELKLMKEFREFVERKIEALMASSTFPLGVG